MANNNLDKSKIADRFTAWRNDWNLFAHEVFKVKLDREQQEILSACQFEKMVSVASGTARGKDFVASVAAMCFFYLTPIWDEQGEMIQNTKVAMTAPSDRQVGNIIYPEISRLFKKAKFLPGRLVGYDIRTDNEEWFLTGFKADETQTEVWTGFHAVNTMFVVTEASGMPDKVFEAIEGNLQGNSRLLLVFNPNRNIGYAANTFRDVREQQRWSKFRLDSLTAPNVLNKKADIPGQVDYEWVIDKIKTWCNPVPRDEKGKLQISQEIEGDFLFDKHWYRPNDLFRVKVRGMFPRASEDVLIPIEWVKQAWQRWNTQRKFPRKKPLRLGADAAGMGRDMNTMCYRYGDFVEKFTQFNAEGKALHMEFAGRITQVMRSNYDRLTSKKPKVFVDTIGEGGGVYSRLIELAEDQNHDYPFLEEAIYSVKHSNAPEYEGATLSDRTKQYKFLNMRAYLMWCVRDWLNPEFNSDAALPEDLELAEELSTMKWEFMSNGKIKIEAKEDIKQRINRSPDKADSLASTFYPVEDFDIHLHNAGGKASDYFPM